MLSANQHADIFLCMLLILYEHEVIRRSPSSRHYCPAGTTVTIPCRKGTYGPTQQLASQADCKGCDPGEFCAVDGRNQTSGNCSAGFFCKENASVSEPTDGVTGTNFIDCDF